MPTDFILTIGRKRGLSSYGFKDSKKQKMAITIKRIYAPAAKTDGFRILVDRLWPRGISKEKARIDLWLKEVAPSTDLRNWFNHEPEKWKEFCIRYKMELKDSAALSELRTLLRSHRDVTLLYAAKDEQHNQALALQHHILGQ
jgi:uncharacterized protein YeaO (DUF488 family)